MRKLFTVIAFCISSSLIGQNITTKFEQSKGTQTPTYFEIIDWWKKLDEKSGKIKMLTMGMSDAGYPLNLIVIGNNGDYNFDNIRKNNKRVILINNGIHPGEPDGIDASMLMARDIVTNKIAIPDNIVLAIIPVYNIGGCLNRSTEYRVDQNGPEEFGSRGNSQNLDLNRDFIKCDSKEARSFAEIFHLTDPDIFLDNHVSDGADYQHIMTLICTQHDKLGGVMGEYLNKNLEPGLYASMKQKGYDLIPYVNSFSDTPDSGWPEFFEGPRYSSGYAALWHCFSFVAETHMLKPYEQRVKATYELMRSFIEYASQNSAVIKQLREQTKKKVLTQPEFPISWTNDRTRSSKRIYKGYTAGRKASEVSGQQRLYYDRSKPYEKEVPFFNFYNAGTLIKKPLAYIIPQGWYRVIDLLKINKIKMNPLTKDTTIEVEVYHIDDYKSAARPYEMHHINSDVKTSVSVQQIKFRKGDYYIPMNQTGNRFLVETLEPAAPDSYFAWNFFDGILGQKEGYSGYAFEDIAADYLSKNAELKIKLEQKRNSDTAFAKNGRAQLNFVYENSPWFEPEYLRYPVYRIVR